MPDPTKPVTLADLDRQGKLAWVYCNECGRERDVPPRDLGLPLDTPAPEAGKRLVCSACGDRKVTVRPELYPGGVEEASRELKRRRRARHKAGPGWQIGGLGEDQRERAGSWLTGPRS